MTPPERTRYKSAYRTMSLACSLLMLVSRSYAQDITFPIGAFHSYNLAEVDPVISAQHDSAGLNLWFTFRATPRDGVGFPSLLAKAEDGSVVLADRMISAYAGDAFHSVHLEVEDKTIFRTSSGLSTVEDWDHAGLVGEAGSVDSAWIAVNNPNSVRIFGCEDKPDSDGFRNGICDCTTDCFSCVDEPRNYECDGEGHAGPSYLIREVLELDAHSLAEGLYTFVAAIRMRVEGNAGADSVLSLTVCQGTRCNRAKHTFDVVSGNTGGWTTVRDTFQLQPMLTGVAISYTLRFLGKRRTEVDHLHVYNLYADSLLRGDYDADIVDRFRKMVGRYTDKLHSVYLNDEPSFPTLEAWEHVKKLLRDSASVRSFTAFNPRFAAPKNVSQDRLRRFNTIAKPELIAVDLYPVWCGGGTCWVPPSPDHPFPENGVFPSFPEEGAVYRENVRAGFDLLAEKLDVTRSEVRKTDPPKDFWYIPPAFGVLDTSRTFYRLYRPTTGPELSAATHLGLAYGAKGLLYWLYKTIGGSVGLVDARYKHNDNFDKGLYTGYKDRWLAFSELNRDIQRTGRTLLQLESEYAYLYDPLVPQGAYVHSIIDRATVQDAEDIHVALFSGTDANHFMLVNRQTFKIPYNDPEQWSYEQARRDLSVFMDDAVGLPPYVTNLTDSTVHPVWDDGHFATTLMPGQGKLYAIAQCDQQAILSDTVRSSLVVALSDSISTSQYVVPGQTVNYRAGTAITLAEGFSAGGRDGGAVRVQIAACANYPQPDNLDLDVSRNDTLRTIRRQADGISRVTAVRSEKTARFELEPNYPNPFNPATAIRYSIPSWSRVNLQIYDVRGAVVKTLVDREQSPGRYSVVFDAGSLASGVYFYKLVAEGFVETRSMLLVK